MACHVENCDKSNVIGCGDTVVVLSALKTTTTPKTKSQRKTKDKNTLIKYNHSFHKGQTSQKPKS